MNSFQSEMVRLGFVSKETNEQRQKRERIQAERRSRKVNHKAVGLNPRNRFASVKEFLKELPSRLVRPADMKEVFRDAHWLADDLALNRNKRARLHAFLCRIAERTNQMDFQDFVAFLKEEIRKY